MYLYLLNYFNIYTLSLLTSSLCLCLIYVKQLPYMLSFVCLVAVFLSFIRTRASHEGACMMIGQTSQAENQYGADSVCFLYRMFLPDVTQKITLNARGLCGNLHSGYLEKRTSGARMAEGTKQKISHQIPFVPFTSMAAALLSFKSSGIGCQPSI